MATFTYPTSAELNLIAQRKMPRLTADREVFSFFPIRTQDAYNLLWEQLDNFIGLQAIRGINGSPTRVVPVGINRFQMDPGVYGEFMSLDELQLTQRRAYGTFGTPVNVEDLVLEKQDQLLLRRLERIELIIWTLLGTGTFSVAAPASAGGGILYTGTFPVQTFSASVPWSTVATATPLADIRAVQLKRRGFSVSFGADATLYMNQTTFNNMIANTNAADLFGRRTAGLGTFNNLTSVNALLMGDNLPKIVIYDETYYDDTSTFQLFIPNGTAILVGRRPAGQVVGEYRMVRNANNTDLAPGPYMKIVDNGEREVPRRIDVHDGHNGGPVLFYGSAVVAMTNL